LFHGCYTLCILLISSSPEVCHPQPISKITILLLLFFLSDCSKGPVSELYSHDGMTIIMYSSNRVFLYTFHLMLLLWHIYFIFSVYIKWLHGLRHVLYSAFRILRPRVWIPLWACIYVHVRVYVCMYVRMYVCFFECCVVLCRYRPWVGLIPHPSSPTKCLNRFIKFRI
jgi:hypothetical protein